MNLLASLEHHPLKRTHIMYRANLAWHNLRVSLDGLVKLGLVAAIDEVGSHRMYELTEKGREALQIYKRLLEFTHVGEPQIFQPVSIF